MHSSIYVLQDDRDISFSDGKDFTWVIQFGTTLYICSST